jgi:hypothetical protein
MVTPKLLLEYADDNMLHELYQSLDTLLLALSKYAVIPVCVIQFLVSRINLKPIALAMAYNDKDIITSLSKHNNYLNVAMMEASPDLTNPTIIVSPSLIATEDVLYTIGEQYYYASAYLVEISALRDALKEKSLKRFALYTNNDRTVMNVSLEFDRAFGIMKLPELHTLPIKLPFRNISAANPHYNGILKAIMEGSSITQTDEEIQTLYETVRKEQLVELDGVKVLKDFIKQKPKTLHIYHAQETIGSDTVSTVCLVMSFNNNLKHILFYRYLDGVVNKILGTIDEVKHHGQ